MARFTSLMTSFFSTSEPENAFEIFCHPGFVVREGNDLFDGDTVVHTERDVRWDCLCLLTDVWEGWCEDIPVIGLQTPLRPLDTVWFSLLDVPDEIHQEHLAALCPLYHRRVGRSKQYAVMGRGAKEVQGIQICRHFFRTITFIQFSPWWVEQLTYWFNPLSFFINWTVVEIAHD